MHRHVLLLQYRERLYALSLIATSVHSVRLLAACWNGTLLLRRLLQDVQVLCSNFILLEATSAHVFRVRFLLRASIGSFTGCTCYLKGLMLSFRCLLLLLIIFIFLAIVVEEVRELLEDAQVVFFLFNFLRLHLSGLLVKSARAIAAGYLARDLQLLLALWLLGHGLLLIHTAQCTVSRLDRSLLLVKYILLDRCVVVYVQLGEVLALLRLRRNHLLTESVLVDPE